MNLSILFSEQYRKIARDGLWDNNVVLTQNLALCPLLAVTGTATNGLGMGLATMVVMVASNAAVSVSRHLIPSEIRIPIFVLLIAALVTLVDIFLNAWMHELHKVLGLFIPLIVTNCVILGRAEAFASKQPVMPSMWDGLMMGVGFTAAMVVLGAMREISSAGTLFANASVLLGESFRFLETTLIPEYKGFLLMALPPGGFIMLGFMVALKRLLDRKAVAKSTEPSVIDAIVLEEGA
ncbi:MULTISPECIES: electron transport complex subunit E [Methylomonas]|uniref:Ion-translocating oxidoreductase complex subunit E n=2 Tax=Methylomonas TaxID=416 RepID=A0A126T2A2_9GAMM|nr:MULTISPECIES: electron transport complex subunit E [Methylomonas]AMK75834.1 electron transport complex subunit RsxE [Methylomonas denitrificans]OAH98588.1 electron transport complex subunit RsxE [Methylomonas methanica]TCV80191.1 electron transport complex protein RnfE [Methylomonas methanica]